MYTIAFSKQWLKLVLPNEPCTAGAIDSKSTVPYKRNFITSE